MQYRMGSRWIMLYRRVLILYIWFSDMHSVCDLQTSVSPQKKSAAQLDNPGSRSWNFRRAHPGLADFLFFVCKKIYIIPYKYWATLCNFRATKNQGDSRGQTDGTVSFLNSFSTGWLYCWFSDSRKKIAGPSFELFHGVQKSILFALKLVKWEKILLKKDLTTSQVF